MLGYHAVSESPLSFVLSVDQPSLANSKILSWSLEKRAAAWSLGKRDAAWSLPYIVRSSVTCLSSEVAPNATAAMLTARPLFSWPLYPILHLYLFLTYLNDQ